MAARRRHSDPAHAVPTRILVIGTQRGVGKSVVTGGLALLLRQMGVRVGVFKPISVTGRRDRHGPVASDAEFLAHCAESSHPLAAINPVVFLHGSVPAFCAERDRQPIDLELIRECMERVSLGCSLLLIEAVGGLLEPLDRQRTLLDLAASWDARIVLVTPSSADAVNQVLMATECMRHRQLRPLAVLLNHYDADTASLADEINPDQIATFAGVDVPFMVPHDATTSVSDARVGEDVLAALLPVANRILARR